MTTVIATQDNFESLVHDNEMVIVDFWAPWCSPCRSFAPVFETASEKYQNILFVKVDTDEQQGLARAFQIRSIPTLMVFRQQIILFSQPGAIPSSVLENIIEQGQALDMDEVRRNIASQPKTELG